MRSRLFCLLSASLLLITACSETPQTEKTGTKTGRHVWSDQTDALIQAREVAKFTDEQERLKQRRLDELGVGR